VITNSVMRSGCCGDWNRNRNWINPVDDPEDCRVHVHMRQCDCCGNKVPGNSTVAEVWLPAASPAVPNIRLSHMVAGWLTLNSASALIGLCTGCLEWMDLLHPKNGPSPSEHCDVCFKSPRACSGLCLSHGAFSWCHCSALAPSETPLSEQTRGRLQLQRFLCCHCPFHAFCAGTQ
jgi:hypothetical protein